MKLNELCALVVAAVALFAVPRIAAAQESPTQFERVKGLKPFIGNWEGEFPGS